MLGKRAAALSWSQLSPLAARWSAPSDPTSGPTSAQSKLRLFGAKESDVRVTLYRDNHAWCPYCQKCWLWLEEKQVPYKIEKITMFCYGEKEAAYKRLVPSGMLPALSIDGRMITESDRILMELEHDFGPLGEPALSNQLDQNTLGGNLNPTPAPPRPRHPAFARSRTRTVTHRP